jgi:hypothetical protein
MPKLPLQGQLPMMSLERLISHVREDRAYVEALRPEVTGWSREEKRIFDFLEESVVDLERLLAPFLDEWATEHKLLQ